MNEQDTARRIATGGLPSPTRFGNFALVALRITGTGAASRDALNEHVYRDPNLWLNAATMERIAGLPVIVEHPERGSLNSAEYARRAVGNVQYPYIADRNGFENAGEGPDIWAVVRIYDDATLDALLSHQLSTSPAVVFRPSDGSQTVPLNDGTHMLIEGDPSLIDHIAIVESGVWDKGEAGEAGVRIDKLSKDKTMTEEEMAADKARRDAEEKARKDADDQPEAGPRRDADAGEKLDKLLSHLDSISARLDAMEEADRERRDAARRDTRRDARRDADCVPSNGRFPGDPEPLVADAERERRDAAEKAEIQARADSVARAHGSVAPAPMVGESVLAYRQRLARGFQRHSKGFDKLDLRTLTGDAFTAIENKIYADAAIAANAPEFISGGPLREITKVDPHTGQRMTTFHGDHTFISEMSRPARRVVKINRKFD